MATTTNKQAVMEKAASALKKRYPEAGPLNEPLSVLDHLIYAICREGSPSADATRAFDRLRKSFFDWNEIRVSSVHEVEDVLDRLEDSSNKARRIIGILQQIFDKKFSFDALEELDKKGLKKAATELSGYGEVNDFVLAWVIQKALGGHAFPLDQPSMRVLARLGVIDSPADVPEVIRGSVEHMVPKAKGPLIVELISTHAAEMCTEEKPACSECPLKKDCPAGQERIRDAAASARAARVKPR